MNLSKQGRLYNTTTLAAQKGFHYNLSYRQDHASYNDNYYSEAGSSLFVNLILPHNINHIA